MSELTAALVAAVAPRLRALAGAGGPPVVVATGTCERSRALATPDAAPAGTLVLSSSSPDAAAAEVVAAVRGYVDQHGRGPRLVAVRDHALFAVGADRARAARTLAVALGDDTGEDDTEATPLATGRLAGTVALVTGAAQGFGLGLTSELLAHGASVVLADLNLAGARREAKRLASDHGVGRTLAVAIDVAQADSCLRAVAETVAHYGGLDLFVSNAGIARADGVLDQAVADFDLVTAVNYRGYFLGVRAVAPVMAAQFEADPTRLADIVEINSKSGLEGSKRNFAYAGSKFGGIGLTQSFALELIEHGIKVNAICPGNYLDGPLWTDPERGLFVQYLQAGKVPGATSVADVRAFYEAKVPMGRGCTPLDVSRALLYLVEQQYETGQALPVTGGQNMVH